MKLKPNWREGRSPQEIAFVERKLAEAAKLFEDNPIAAWRPYPKQERYMASRHFLKVFAAGNGAGKSAVGVVDDLIQLLDADVLPAHLRKHKWGVPPFHMRIVVPKFGVAEAVVLEQFRALTPPAQFMGGNFDKAYDKVNRKVRFANGSWVLINTAEQDVSAHAGVELSRVRFDEEPEGEHGFRLYNENLMRLRKAMPRAQVCFTFTPQNGYGWTFDLIWEKRGEEVEPNVFENDRMLIVVASMLDNPHLDAAELLLEMADLPQEEYAARVNGEFISFHGLVLNNFRERESDRGGSHVVDPPSAKHVQGLQNYVVIDPGIARGAVVFGGFDRENTLLIWDELYPGDLDIRQYAEAIRGKLKEWGVQPVAYLIDPSSRNRNLATGENLESLFLKEGIPTLPGSNERRAGVLEMRKRISGDALFVSSACVNWLAERRRWVVAEDETSDKPSAGGDTFKTKGPDHLMDCFDSETEVLTDRGWVRFPDLDRTEMLATVNLDTDLIEFQAPTDWVQRHHRGEMVRIGGRKMDALVTPTHRMVVYPRSSDRPEFRLAGELSVWDRVKLNAQWAGEKRGPVDVRAAHGKPASVDPLVWAELLGWYVAEGWSARRVQMPGRGYQVGISQTPGAKCDDLGRLLAQTPWKWRYAEGQYVTSSKWLHQTLSPLGDAYTKRAPRWVLDSEPQVIEAFLRGAVMGDGWVQAGSRSYASVSRGLADDVQEAFIKIGRSASVRLGKAAGTWSIEGRSGDTVDQWWVAEWTCKYGHLRDSANRPNFEKVPYDGTVYCATVPNGTLIVRRNGKPMVAGNCTRYLVMERLWFSPAESGRKKWHPSMGGAPPASWFRDQIESGGPPLGSMT